MTTTVATIPQDPLVVRPARRTLVQLLAVAVLFTLVGLWYAGPTYIKHMDRAIPHHSLGGAVLEMAPGDQYDGYYRHLLPYFNLKRGNPPYDTSYQYNLGRAEPFREGMIYLPFSMLASLLAFVVGPVLAYNLLVLLSFPLCAVFGYLLGREVTGGSRAGGLLAASVITLVPFRIGFLFEQTFYGTDIALLPLALFTFVRFLKAPDWRYALAFGVAILTLATANIALFYWFAVLFGPFFLGGSLYTARMLWGQWKKIAGIAVAAVVPLALALLFLLYVRDVMAASGLGTGQGLDEVRHFSPKFIDLLRRWSGIETTVYLGSAGILAGIGALSLLFRRPVDRVICFIVAYAAGAYFMAYALALGTTLDDATGVPLYAFVFEHLPFANGSRTPGRIIPIAIACAAILVPVAWRWIATYMKRPQWRTGLAVVLVMLFALDFKYSHVSMTKLAGTNRAYSAIAGAQGTAIGIPIRPEAEHYLHATYQYFAVTHDVRMVNGHSSMFPPGWSELYGKVSMLNQGMATRAVLQELWSRGVRHVVAHGTSYEPRVSPMAIAILDDNPGLRRIGEDAGITSYEIVDPARAPVAIDAEVFVGAAMKTAGSANASQQSGPGVQELSGWYAREVYPGQVPFRWMAGRNAMLLVTPAGASNQEVVFEYRCPLGDLIVEGLGVGVAREPGTTAGWTLARVSVPAAGRQSVVSLSAAAIYRVNGDPREFGCMVGDFSLR